VQLFSALEEGNATAALVLGLGCLAAGGLAFYLYSRGSRTRIAVLPRVVLCDPRRAETARLEDHSDVAAMTAGPPRVSIEIHNRGPRRIDCKAVGFGSRSSPFEDRPLREAQAASARSARPESPWPGPIAPGSALELDIDPCEMRVLIDDLEHGFLGRIWIATETGDRYYAKLSDTKRFIKELKRASKADERAQSSARLP